MGRQSRLVLLTAVLAGAILIVPERAAALAFIFETIDASADVGQNNSLVLDASGNPHVAYWDFTSKNLKYSVRVGGVWTAQTIDGSSSTGQSPSIALDSSGNPRIAYLRAIGSPLNLILKYAEHNGVGWSITSFDLADDIGVSPSLAVDASDTPHISHYDFTNRDLLYQYFSGPGWTIERVDSVGFVGSGSSLAIDSMGRPHITYYDQTNTSLKYAVKIAGVWMVETVDGFSPTGSSSSLAIDSSDNPHVAYYNSAAGAVQYAVKSDGSWSFDLVDATGDAGINISLVLDSSDRAYMSYQEATDDDLIYATGNLGSWQVVKIDSLNSVGFDSSIQLGPGELPRISYHDFTVKTLRFAEAVHPIRVPDHFPTIQLAINAACEGDSVLVAPGTYTGSGNRNLNFGGKNLVVVSEGGMGAATIHAEGVARGFFLGSGETAASIIDGFRITQTNDTGIRCINSSPTIRNCEISVISSGNGIVLDQSSSLVENCMILDNQTSSSGVGILIVGGAPVIRNCEIINNRSEAGDGGGVLIENSTAIMESCVVMMNSSDEDGGGIYITGAASPSILGCTFDSNLAGTVGNARRGGGIHCFDAPVTISGCRFRGNSADKGGAIALLTNSQKDATIEDCLFYANRAYSEGGALWMQGYNPMILGSTIVYNNSDVLGGGIHFADDDTALVERSIILDNCAGTAGDEIYFDSSLPDLDVEVTFVCCDVDSSGFSGAGTWILLSDNFSEDPVFVNPGNCDLFPDWPGFDLACGSPCLASTSPCGETIGAGEEDCVVVAVLDPPRVPVNALQLSPASPNPFSGGTRIRYELPHAARVTLRVHDLRGRVVRELFSGFRDAGPGETDWDGRDDGGRRLSSGIYFIRLEAGSLNATRRTVLLTAGR